MTEIVIKRPPAMCDRLVVVDGIPGCGKTMLSAIIGSLERVELLKYSYEIEQYAMLHYFGNMSTNTASHMIQYQLDLMIYNQMMARDLNFRYSDLSSVFNSVGKTKYFRRLFAKGDEVIPQKIKDDKPILQMATHCISAFSKPLMDVLKGNMVLINMHRHPLFMLKQNVWNVENLINNQRDFALYYEWQGLNFPFFFFGQEERMLKANEKEKAIYFVEWLRRKYHENNIEDKPSNYIELTFESFVTDPYPYLDKICGLLDTQKTKFTPKILKREKIPRDLLTHGKDLPIYRRVNWQKTNSATNEEEIQRLYTWATDGISSEAKAALDWLIDDYRQIVDKITIRNE